ncbi:tetratricopeptide repeat protein [Planktomarina temperata]|nr:tetratricopeptide repeat protein [Planktomarina temperata]
MTELTIDQALKQAIEAHKAGQVQEADRLYTAILKTQPKHPDANHNMGVLAVGVGKVEQALPFFKTALEANPATAQFWISYIHSLIKLERLVDAKAVFDQAKSKGAKGDSFDKIEQRLNKTGEEPIVASKITTEVPPQQPNILDSLKLDQAIKLATKKTKDGSPEEAKHIYQDILTKFPKNKRASDGLKGLVSTPVGKASKGQNPPQAQIQELINFYSQGQLQQALQEAEALAQQFPQSAILFNIQGAVLKGLGRLDLTIEAYNKALAIKPDYAEAYYNMGNALQEQGKLEKAMEAYKKALAIKPNNAEAYYNMGNVLKYQGKLEEAIKAYNKALAIKPDHADACNNIGNALLEQGKLEEAREAYGKALQIKPDCAKAYNNMGATLKEQGKLEEAIASYKKALAINLDYAEAYSNMGVIFKEQGKLEEALEAYNKALAINPDYAKAHRHLSLTTKYNSDTAQISKVESLLQRTGLNDTDRCHLLYTYAKMQEDLGNLSSAFNSYVAGGDLRKKLLKYEFSQDEHLFSLIKQTAPKLKDISLSVTLEPLRHTPIFILGMPRSGTTLVEQIVSSHTEVTGAGELEYASRLGTKLVAGITSPTLESVSAFREQYQAELAKRSEGRAFVSDKMPHNFQYIALICTAFPEAKIVHVERSVEATCWSNFKHYFASKSLGYSYNLSDTVNYYGLYKDLMHFWSQSYSDRIYTLDYDKLTEYQEPQTRRLIEYLGLDWEVACLAPENNKRIVKTASRHQVRQKVYTGSSQAWREYEPFLNGVFNFI